MDEAATKKVAKWSALITSGNSNCLIIKLIGQWWVYTLNKFQRFGFSKTLILSFSKDALKLFKVTENLYLFYIWRAALKKYYPFKKKKKCFICTLYHLWGNSEHAAGTMKMRLWNRERHVVISSTEIRSHIFGISIVAIFIIRNVITYNTPTIMTCSGPWRNVIFCNRFKNTNKCKDVLYKKSFIYS